LLTSINSSPALFRALLAAAIAISCVATQVSAADVEIPPAVADYASALDDLKTSRGKSPIEPVFEAGMKVSPQVQAVLPDLSESQYQQVQRQMQGFMVVRQGPTIVRPSVDYFRTLARKQGTKADRAFFAIYSRTEPDGNGPFPAYIQQQTGESGCTRFDGKLMVDLYRGWMTFRTMYPTPTPPKRKAKSTASRRSCSQASAPAKMPTRPPRACRHSSPHSRTCQSRQRSKRESHKSAATNQASASTATADSLREFECL
jgi:hypothetical protein